MSIWKLRATPSQGVNAVSIFWYCRALKGPIAALSLKYINHPAIILFYAPLYTLYTEGEDFPLISCIITRISVQAAPLLPKSVKRRRAGGAAKFVYLGAFSISLLFPVHLSFPLSNIDPADSGADDNDSPLSLHVIFNHNVARHFIFNVVSELWRFLILLCVFSPNSFFAFHTFWCEHSEWVFSVDLPIQLKSSPLNIKSLNTPWIYYLMN